MANRTLREGAKRLGVSHHTLRQWAVYQRRIPYLKLGKRIIVKDEDLDAFEQANRVEAR